MPRTTDLLRTHRVVLLTILALFSLTTAAAAQSASAGRWLVVPTGAAAWPDRGAHVSHGHPAIAPLIDDVARARAVTRLERPGNGQIRATIVVGLETNLAELLGHEFEHVIEQLDGVHVPERYRLGDDGTHPSGGHRFETRRAVLAGHIVAAECAERAAEARP